MLIFFNTNIIKFPLSVLKLFSITRYACDTTAKTADIITNNPIHFKYKNIFKRYSLKLFRY